MDNNETIMARCLRLEAELAEERRSHHEAMHREYCRREELERKLDDCLHEVEEQARLNGMGSEREARLLAQLAATQADNERLRNDMRTIESETAPEDGRVFELVHGIASDALSRPINLDALNEARAEVADGAAAVSKMFGHDGITNTLRELAAAYRAKKEG